jgi:hypothetical protein
MQYSFLKSCLLAIATASSVVLAQTSGFNVMTKPLVGEAVPANTVYDIVWTPSAAYPGKISIVFYGGSAANTLAVISTVASKPPYMTLSNVISILTSVQAELIPRSESSPGLFQPMPDPWPPMV